MPDHVPYVDTSLEILDLMIAGYKRRDLLDYAASLEFARDTIAENYVKSLYDEADGKNTPDQLAV